MSVNLEILTADVFEAAHLSCLSHYIINQVYFFL